MKRSRLGISVAIVLVGLAALPLRADDKKSNVNDIGNRRVAHRSIISEAKEVAIGKQYAAEIDKTAKLITDPVITEYVNRVAQNVARNSDLKVPLTVKVIDDPTINAVSLPGGFIYVNSGVLQAADEEDQLAGVIAHEIGHIAARHWAETQTRATFLQYATIPLIFIPMSYPVYIGATSALNYGIPTAFSKFTRDQEAEADYLGLQYMYKAGYDPNSYVTFFGKVLQEERRQPGSVSSVFMDHPPTASRIIKCEEEIKTVLPKRDQYLVSTSEFNDVKARLQTVLTARLKTQEAGPSLEKRKDADKTGTVGAGKGGDHSGDKPPVLKRSDDQH